jgi:hypothetical protein
MPNDNTRNEEIESREESRHSKAQFYPLHIPEKLVLVTNLGLLPEPRSLVSAAAPAASTMMLLFLVFEEIFGDTA